MNFQESTTILNACTKKSGSLLKAPRMSKELRKIKGQITMKNRQIRKIRSQKYSPFEKKGEYMNDWKLLREWISLRKSEGVV